MIRYVFNEDEPIRIKGAAKANPQVIGEELDRIAKGAGGRLTPKAVVDEARAITNPLHPHFEWNDASAAEMYRVDQARNIIRIVRVEDESCTEGHSRAFFAVNDDGFSYRAVAEIKGDVNLQTSLLKQAEQDLLAFQRRYKSLQEICEIVAMAQKAVRHRINKQENRAAA